MKHPFEILKPEYSLLLAAMKVRPEKQGEVDRVARKLLGFKTTYYMPVFREIGVPPAFVGPSFEREGSSNFKLNPAQGAPLNEISKMIPHNGPFPNWHAAAIAAYKLNGLDRVGASNWTWELICFYGEIFNGLGYRDFHHMHTPYLWGGTNIQTPGKYTSDGHFDAAHFDEQLGIIPIGCRMAELDAECELHAVIPPPQPSGVASPADTGVDTRWVQKALNDLGQMPPLITDGSYGKTTMRSVELFQKNWGIQVDGMAGPKTVEALKTALANHSEQVRTDGSTAPTEKETPLPPS